MKKSVKHWYNHIFRSMKARIQGLYNLRKIGKISDEKFADDVMTTINTFETRTNEFIEEYISPPDRVEFRKLIESFAKPKSILVKVLQFLGL